LPQGLRKATGPAARSVGPAGGAGDNSKYRRLVVSVKSKFSLNDKTSREVYIFDRSNLR